MTSFFNFYSNIKDLIEPSPKENNFNKSVKSLHPRNQTTTINTPASTQGANFKKYQQKIQKTTVGKNRIKNIFKEGLKEGFQTLPDLQLDGNGLTYQTNSVIGQNQKNYSSNPQNNVTDIRSQYDNTLTQYENAIGEITGTTTSYFDRVSPNNPYLNQIIQFSTGELSYVTNQGVAKYIPSTDILNSINAPSKYMDVNIPFDNSYKNQGATIGTTPNLITGTPVVSGQSLGNEGQNVYVNTMITNPTPSYVGCYQDNTSSPLMEFIGGSPPSTTITIQNGDFAQPAIANNSYEYISSIIGWEGNFVFVNNSGAWGYPSPYPYGNQCVTIQVTQYIQTSYTLNLGGGTTYNISFYTCGRNCCDGGVNPIEVSIQQIENSVNIGTTIIATVTPVIDDWQQVSYDFVPPLDGNYILMFQGTWGSTDRSTALQHVTISVAAETGGTYTYEGCQEAAIDAGYQYFALQNVNTSTSTGYCAVSNSEPTATQLGTGNIPSKQVPLWSSNTQGQTGNTAILGITGALSVINSGGQAVFNTPVQPTDNYLGCYRDCVPNCNYRAMGFANGGSQSYNLSECQQFAQDNNYQYFGLQNSTSGTTAQCAVSNDFSQATQFGASSNCMTISDGTYTAGGSTNAIYNFNPEGNYYLILQDDGNMCVYRGQNPNDNQGGIWCSGTNGQQQQPNPAYAAVNGKYGTNWIASGSTLAAGDFVGSTNGNLVLVMQTDGNLVLYTYKNVLNCQIMTDGNTGGGVGANALYNIGKVGVKSNMSQLAYVDENSETHPYSSTNKQYINSYTTIFNNKSSGNAIPNAAYGDTTVDDCQQTCNSISQCAGFVFNTDNNVCTPMDSSMFPNGTREISNGNDLYIRNVNPISPPTGVNQNTSNVDTITYQNYVNGGELNSDYGLSSVIEQEQSQVFSLGDQMNSLTGQINYYTDRFNQGARVSSMQSSKNYNGIKNYLTEIKDINNDIKYFNTNADNILKDSDIVVLQQNYNYLFWSILAVATVVISINVVKK
jgi:hypothetical protein